MKKYLALFRDTWTEFSEDKAQRLGAALAYYTLFSIAPLPRTRSTRWLPTPRNRRAPASWG